MLSIISIASRSFSTVYACVKWNVFIVIARELAPVLHLIFEQSLNTGDLPAEWTLANVAPILKKGSKLQTVNYRPVSPTCISFKLFEHIVCKHILGHLEDHGILTDLQHGFRSGRSCETQLITTFHNIASAYNKTSGQSNWHCHFRLFQSLWHSSPWWTSQSQAPRHWWQNLVMDF